MADVLIRDLPDDGLAAIDAQAARLGISRNEYVRRELSQLKQRRIDKAVLRRDEAGRRLFGQVRRRLAARFPRLAFVSNPSSGGFDSDNSQL